MMNSNSIKASDYLKLISKSAKRKPLIQSTKTIFDGEQYASKFEAEYAKELKLRKLGKDILDFKPHPPIDLVVNGYKVCRYTPDFKITHLDGHTEFVDTKSFCTSRNKLVFSLFRALYCNGTSTELTLIYQKDFLKTS